VLSFAVQKGLAQLKKGSNPLFVMREKQTFARARANSVPMVLFSSDRKMKLQDDKLQELEASQCLSFVHQCNDMVAIAAFWDKLCY
jgi:hypothetical protein